MIANFIAALSTLAAFAALADAIAFGRGDPWAAYLLAFSVLCIGLICSLACLGKGGKAQPTPRKAETPPVPSGPSASRVGPTAASHTQVGLASPPPHPPGTSA